MSIRIIRLGSPRFEHEALRIGTVRRPPRGVPKSDHASRNIYDIWFPTLSPSESLLKEFSPSDEKNWKYFKRQFLAEMKQSAPRHDLDLLAALSHITNFSIGCYCADASFCHRSLLGDLLRKRGARILE